MFWRNLVIGGLLAGGLAACGGGGGGSGSNPPPVQPPPPPPVNRAPEVSIITPVTGNSFEDGATVTFEGSALDPEDGALDGARLVWTSGSAQLATGRSFTSDTFEVGTHTIRLAATDAQGLRSETSVSFRVTEPAPAPAPRAGEINPYAGKFRRLPIKRDDEVVLIGRSDSQDQMVLGVVDRTVSQYQGMPTNTPQSPRILARRDDTQPVAAAAGRILLSNHEQGAIVRRSTSAGGAAPFRLDIVELEDGTDPIIASRSFTPPYPDAPIDVFVADLDAFDEVSGARAPVADTERDSDYHDEVALAYPELAGNELLARIHVFSFEDIGLPDDHDDPVPAPTTELTASTTEPMLPGSRLVLRHGDNLFNDATGPHLVVAYLDTSRRVVIDVFRYQHTRASASVRNPRTDTRTLTHVLNVVLSDPLTVAAAAAGGWDLVVARGDRIGVDNIGSADFVLYAYQNNGGYVQELWILESLNAVGGPPEMIQDNLNFANGGRFGSIFLGPPIGSVPVDILPDSKLRIALGRIVQYSTGCEATGLHVLADTNRGPVVQTMAAFTGDPHRPNGTFGPVNSTAPWFDPAIAAAGTTATTRTTLAAGGFVSSRNGLVNQRDDGLFGDPTEAENCQYANTAPLLGPLPSFYVVQPERSLMHSVTMQRVRGTAIVSTPIDASFESVPFLLAADINGDAAYYDSRVCLQRIADVRSECTRIFLGDAELHYMLENIETSNVILQQPPKHVDYLRALGGMVDVSMRPEFYAEFAQTDTASGSVNRKTKTDWSIGSRIKLAIGPPVPKDKDFSSIFELSVDLEHKSVRDTFTASEVSVSLTQTTGAVDDDVVWAKIQTTDFWRFPAQGGKPEDDPDGETGFPDDAFMEIAIPGEPMTALGPGALNDDYQPTHQPGNILSYPTISGSVQDIGELFGMLGGYVPTNEAGSRECKLLQTGLQTDPNGCIRMVNNDLMRVSEILAGEEFIAGEFRTLSEPIDVAEILQVGGISYSAELEFNDTVKRGETVTNTDSLKGEYKVKVPMHGKKLAAEIEQDLRVSASFENARISENSLGTKTRIALHMPSNIPAQRSYRIRPSFGFALHGALQVSYQVSTDGAASTFWQQHYSTPDAALNLPHRIVRAGDGFELNTDFSRNRMKGFFVRDGAGIDPLRPDSAIGRELGAAPLAGDPVQLEARVYNLSVGTPLTDVVVEFSAQEYRNGALVGEPTVLGSSTIQFIPYRAQFSDDPNGHVASAYLIWDTTGFGPAAGQSLKDYVIFVTVDPDDVIHNETHELQDRYNEPLRGPGDAVVDNGLEKGQNNRGWSMVRIAPSLEAQSATVSAAPMSKLQNGGAGKGDSTRSRVALNLTRPGPMSPNAPLRGKRGQSLSVNVRLQAEELSRHFGVLQIFDGDPASGGSLLATRRVQGISADGIDEVFHWRPTRSGDRVLYARYLGEGAPVVLQIPTRIAH